MLSLPNRLQKVKLNISKSTCNKSRVGEIKIDHKPWTKTQQYRKHGLVILGNYGYHNNGPGLSIDIG